MQILAPPPQLTPASAPSQDHAFEIGGREGWADLGGFFAWGRTLQECGGTSRVCA